MRPPVLSPFRRLNTAERRLRRAVAAREEVDLRRHDDSDDPALAKWWPADRTVRASVLTDLLSAESGKGRTPSLQLIGARIIGNLDLRDVTLTGELHLAGCAVEGEIHLIDATTRSVRLNECRIRRVHAARSTILGVLSLDGSTILQGVRLDDAYVSGVLRANRAEILAPEKVAESPLDSEAPSPERPAPAVPWGVFAGGVKVDGGTFLRRSMIEGIRIPGATLSGGLHMEYATIRNDAGPALYGDRLETVAISLRGVTARGTVRLRNARVDGTLGFWDADLSAPHLAVHLSHARVQELVFNPSSVEGGVSLAYSRLAVLYSHPHSYPDMVNLTDTVYESLRPPWSLDDYLSWVDRAPDGYRPQPYEQLAAWYRRVGQDQLARRVQHARDRRRRRTLRLPSRLWGHLLDGLVGNGYRPWMAGIWSALLLTAGTVVFHLVPPTQIDPDERRTFNPFIYTLDLLAPVSVFEQRGAWDPTGGTQWLAWVIVAAGWVLITALIAGATRTLRPGE